jgi:phospholipid/cholesterol/gamma-HCH transport system substrate-binding protein
VETRANYIAVGVFVILLLGGLAIAALWLARGQFAQNTERYETYFASVGTGLGPGSAVRVNGVQVGHVESVRLDPEDPTHVRVILNVDPNAPIRSDSVASVEIQSLTGTAAIEISAGSKNAPEIALQPGHSYPVIWSRESNLEQIVNAVPQLMAKLNDIADQFRQVLSKPNQEALTQTLDNLQQVTAEAAARRNDIGKLIEQGAAGAESLRRAIDNLSGLAPRLNSVADQADTTIRSLNGLVQDNRGALRNFTQTGLPEIQQLVAQTQGLVADLRRTVDELGRNPSRILYGDQREGYRPK